MEANDVMNNYTTILIQLSPGNGATLGIGLVKKWCALIYYNFHRHKSSLPKITFITCPSIKLENGEDEHKFHKARSRFDISINDVGYQIG